MKVNSLGAFNTFTMLCKHHLCMVPKHLHHPKGNLVLQFCFLEKLLEIHTELFQYEKLYDLWDLLQNNLEWRWESGQRCRWSKAGHKSTMIQIGWQEPCVFITVLTVWWGSLHYSRRTGKPGVLQFMGSQRVRHDCDRTILLLLRHYNKSYFIYIKYYCKKLLL